MKKNEKKTVFHERKDLKMIEIWKNIPGITGYQASSLGRIRSMERKVDVEREKFGIVKKSVKQRVLKSCKTYEYGRQHYVTVRIDGHTKNVHRLVALAFLGPPPFGKKTEVNHKDGNRHNNVLSNLEWCSKKMNVQHSRDVLKANRTSRGITKAEPSHKKGIKKNENYRFEN